MSVNYLWLFFQKLSSKCISGKKIYLVPMFFVLMFVVDTGSLQAFIFVPLTLIGLGIPTLLCGQAAGKKAGIESAVRQTITNVDQAVVFVRLFLFALGIVIAFLLLCWAIKSVRTMICRRRFRNVLSLLYRLQSDVVLLKNASVLEKEELFSLELSKKEVITILLQLFRRRFFMKKMGVYLHNRIKYGTMNAKYLNITLKKEPPCAYYILRCCLFYPFVLWIKLSTLHQKR